MSHFKFWYLLLISLMLFFVGCNYFKVEKINREDVKEAHLKQVIENFQNYPLIDSCDDAENSKLCFEKQVTDLLGNNLNYPNVTDLKQKDTIWLVIQVTKNGDMSLKPYDLENEEFQNVILKIDSTLRATSPIQPAHINGEVVNCNFKLPLIINNKNL